MLAFSFNAYTQTGFAKGTIQYVRTFDSQSNGVWVPPVFWFTLNEVTSANNCLLWSNGHALFVMDTNQALSLILASYTSNREIGVTYDDTVTWGGWCKAKYITLGNPPVQ